MEIIITISRILSLPLQLLILIYQKTLSPDHGLLKPFYPYGYCKFYPTCSEYSRLVLQKQGLLGLPKIINRLISCRPGVAPAVDRP
ncbi:MAG: membrane protein insertion efficiency factor YidD [Candidatus Doudnabacteria bacterium]|nr:membrane protein insertion efficiency factor YidD [Candidatus Doudnabacteria bacterium]